MFHNLEATRFPRELPDHSPVRVLLCDTHLFGVPFPAVEALSVLVWVLGHFPSWVHRYLLALPLAFALVNLTLAIVFALALVQSSDVHRLRGVHQRCSREHDVADLFATDMYVLRRVACITRWFKTSVSLTPLCARATFTASASGVPAGLVLLNEKIQRVK